MKDLIIEKVEDEKTLKEYAKIRHDVFTIEKNVPVAIEVDQYDTLNSICDHFLIVYRHQHIGAIRIMKEKYTIRLQRFCILKEYRQLGIGKQVILYIEKYYKDRNIYHVIMDAKYEVYPFYEKCGYHCVSDQFIEANIPHIKMAKNLLEVKKYDDLPSEAIELRTAIFINEQGFQDEFDDRDHHCIHLVVFDENKAIATCRYFYENDRFVLGRIAVDKEYRGKNIGAYVVNTACRYIGKGEVVLHAQLQAQKFYQELGFQAYGDIEYEEHCPHIWMKKIL